MSCRISVEIDLLTRLEDETSFNNYFDFDTWAPDDTDRLKKIVKFLEYQEREAKRGK